MIMTQHYLQFGGAALGSPNGFFLTVAVDSRETARPRKGQTQTGYGLAIPTATQVKWQGRWRRVKVCQWGNAGTAYIGKAGEWLAIVDRDY